jgi:hypothetical protein
MKGLIQIINPDSDMTDQLLIRCSTHKPTLRYNGEQWTWFKKKKKAVTQSTVLHVGYI